MEQQSSSDPNKNIRRPTFDLEHTQTEDILALNAALEEKRKVEEAKGTTPHAEGLLEALERGLIELTQHNLPKARAVFDALTGSEDTGNRWLAAAGIDHLLQAEEIAGDRQTKESAIHTCIALMFDSDYDVWDLANTVVYKAIRERRIDPEVAGWLLTEVVEAHHANQQS